MLNIWNSPGRLDGIEVIPGVRGCVREYQMEKNNQNTLPPAEAERDDLSGQECILLSRFRRLSERDQQVVFDLLKGMELLARLDC